MVRGGEGNLLNPKEQKAKVIFDKYAVLVFVSTLKGPIR